MPLPWAALAPLAAAALWPRGAEAGSTQRAPLSLGRSRTPPLRPPRPPRGLPAEGCGEATEALQHGGLEREYLVHRPCSDVRGVLVSVHCYGCDASMVFDPYLELAKRRGLVLIAPEGVNRSFNAVDCCGDAQRNKIDDVGFIEAAVKAQAGAQKMPLLVTGHSNGGFMSSLLALKLPGVSAIALSSGHVYAGLESLPPIPALLLWDEQDSFVSYSGCCSDGARPCCCGIGRDVRRCVGAPEIFGAWSRANGCASDGEREDADGGRCRRGTGCEHGGVELCTYRGHRHQAWARIPPVVSARVGAFFGELL